MMIIITIKNFNKKMIVLYQLVTIITLKIINLKRIEFYKL